MSFRAVRPPPGHGLPQGGLCANVGQYTGCATLATEFGANWANPGATSIGDRLVTDLAQLRARIPSALIR